MLSLLLLLLLLPRYIDNSGRACLANVVDIKFEQGIMSYAIPELFPMDSPQCSRKSSSAAPAQIVPAAANGTAASGVVVVDAIPIPGLQNVTVTCSDFHTCGPKM